LKAYAKYFDLGDAHPQKNEIHGSASGSCTLLATYEDEMTQVESELPLAHCTICIAYEGKCCQYSNLIKVNAWGKPAARNTVKRVENTPALWLISSLHLSFLME
jgi:hypothetical protein